MNANDLQSQIDCVNAGEIFKLPKGEYKGPIVIRKSITMEGQNAIIWALEGPVLTIATDGASLSDLSLEITRRGKLEGEKACAMIVTPPGLSLNLSNVSVRGNVRGLEGEEGEWHYPPSLDLHELKAGCRHEFKVRLIAPVPCRLRSEIAGLVIRPATFKAGEIEVTLKLDALSEGTLLRGDITIHTAFLTRRIGMVGNLAKGDKTIKGEGQVIWKPSLNSMDKPLRSDDEIKQMVKELLKKWPMDFETHKTRVKGEIITPYKHMTIDWEEAENRWKKLAEESSPKSSESILEEIKSKIREQPPEPKSTQTMTEGIPRKNDAWRLKETQPDHSTAENSQKETGSMTNSTLKKDVWKTAPQESQTLIKSGASSGYPSIPNEEVESIEPTENLRPEGRKKIKGAPVDGLWSNRSKKH